MIRCLLMVALLGCSQGTSDGSPATPTLTIHPESSLLHQRLYEAAKSQDIAGFQSLLTVESVELMNDYFNRMELLQRPRGAAPYGWADYLKLHMTLAEKSPTTAPYAVKQTPLGARLHMAGHPDSAFLKEAMALPLPSVPESSAPKN